MTTRAQNDKRWWVLLATITASSMAFIDSSALNVALNALQKDLQATGVDLIWVVNAYLLTLAAFILLGGSLGDHYGRNRIFRLGISVFTVTSLICGFAPTIGILIVARAVQGLGGALMVPGSLAIISANFSADERGRAIGTWSSFGTLTTILAPALGGFLAGAGLWRGVFFINLPLALVALFALSNVPETKDENSARELDITGTALITLGLAGLTYGAVGLGNLPDGQSPAIQVLTLIGGIVMLIAFVWVEAHSQHPMVPLGLFKQRTFAGTNLMTVFLYGALSGVLFFLPLNLIQIQGYQENVAGLTFLPLSILLATLSPIMGRLVSRFGPRLLLTVGPAIVGIAFLLLAQIGVTNGPQDYWISYFPVVVILGIGISNTVTRSAQSLATAVLGVIVVVVFTSSLTARTAELGFAPEVQEEVRLNASKLGNTEIPAVLDAASQDQLKQALQRSFIDAFHLIAYIGTGLAWLSAIISAWLVEDHLFLVDNVQVKPSA